MRTLRVVLRKFILPVACFACGAWLAGFVVSYTAMKQHNIGTLVLFAFGGMVLLLPWFVIALAILDRMRSNAAADTKPAAEEELDDSARSGTRPSTN